MLVHDMQLWPNSYRYSKAAFLLLVVLISAAVTVSVTSNYLYPPFAGRPTNGGAFLTPALKTGDDILAGKFSASFSNASEMTNGLSPQPTSEFSDSRIGPLILADSTDSNTFDERVYHVLMKNKVTSVRKLAKLDARWSAALTELLGKDMNTIKRVFSMMYAFKGNFHRTNYSYLLQPTDCATEFTGAVVFVFSMPNSLDERATIRTTWGPQLSTVKPAFFRLLFIMGTVDESLTTTVAAPILQESLTHGDLIFADFEEDYHNLTLKSLVMARWAMVHCPSAKFIIKADADVQVNAYNLVAALESRRTVRRTIMGWVSSGDPVHRSIDNKWYVPPAVFPDDRYPPFAHGPFYVITTDLLADLHKTSLSLNYFHLEDIFVTAICVRSMNDVNLVNIPYFVTWDCKKTSTVVFHDVTCRFDMLTGKYTS